MLLRVSVVDGAGGNYFSQGQDSDFGYTAEQFRLAEQFEGSLNDRIIGILEPILGYWCGSSTSDSRYGFHAD